LQLDSLGQKLGGSITITALCLNSKLPMKNWEKFTYPSMWLHTSRLSSLLDGIYLDDLRNTKSKLESVGYAFLVKWSTSMGNSSRFFLILQASDLPGWYRRVGIARFFAEELDADLVRRPNEESAIMMIDVYKCWNYGAATLGWQS
jgi:hypothetical protein